MRKVITSIVLLLLFAALPLAAEGKKEDKGDMPASRSAVTVTDSLNRKVTIEKTPERIVLTGKATIMLIDALYLFEDISERVAAVGKTDQGLGDFFPVVDPNAGDKIRMDNTAGVEEILAAEPDLVILKSMMRRSLGKNLEQVNVPVVYLDLETPEQYKRDIRTLGTLLNQRDRAEEVISLFEQRANYIAEQVDGKRPVRTAVLSYSQRGNTYSFGVPPESWIQTTQVHLAGGKPVWLEGVSGPGWNTVQFEQIAAWAPEAVFVISYRTPAKEVVDKLLDNELWQKLSAAENNKIYPIPNDFYSWGQPDTRWILGAEWIARKLHPGAFTDTTFKERAALFFKELYGIEKDRFEKMILPQIPGDLD